MSVIAPRTRKPSPINDRATCGGSLTLRATFCAVLGLRARERVVLVLVRRVDRVAISRCLDLDDHGEDHWPPLRALVQVLREAVLDLCLEQCRLAGVVAGVLDRCRDAVDSTGDDR